MSVEWTKKEVAVLKLLKTPEKIQLYLEKTPYNPDYIIKSPRLVLKEKTAHCFEGALLAAAALEYHGQKAYLLHLKAFNDDHHVVTLFKDGSRWGAISKTNTTMLGYRSALFPTAESVAASYFDFYFNMKAQKSLLGFAGPISLSKYKKWNWQTSEEDLTPMGLSFLKLEHKTLATKGELLKTRKVSERLKAACFYQSNTKGLY